MFTPKNLLLPPIREGFIYTACLAVAAKLTSNKERPWKVAWVVTDDSRIKQITDTLGEMLIEGGASLKQITPTLYECEQTRKQVEFWVNTIPR
jgi:hypothetical protein